MLTSIKARVTVLFMAASLLSVILVLVVASSIVSNEAEELFENSSFTEIKLVDDVVINYMQQAVSSAKEVALLPDLQNAAVQMTYNHTRSEPMNFTLASLPEWERKIAESFYRTEKSHDVFSCVYYGSSNGEIILSHDVRLPASFDPRKRPWYKKALSSSAGSAISNAYVSTAGNTVATALQVVRNPQGKLLGVIGVDILLDNIVDMLSQLRIGKTGTLLLIEKNGTVLVAPEHKEITMKRLGTTGVADLDALARKEDGVYAVSINGIQKFIRIYTSEKTDYKFLLSIDRAEVLEIATDSSYLSFLCGLVVAAVVGLLGYLILLKTFKPLNLLVQTANNVKEGRLDQMPSESRFNGELREVYLALREMVASLVESLNVAKRKSAEAEEQTAAANEAFREAEAAQQRADVARREGLLDAASQLEAIVANVSSVSEELSALIEQTRRGTERQAARSSETATAMEQMNIAVNEVARNASDAAQNAEAAHESVVHEAEAVNNVVETIDDVAERSNAMMTSLSELGEKAEDIGQIMEVISDIADQTNLLALNAAIEAARAGEAGRGFAVVADEVRKLAEKTMQATSEVGNAVQSIQQGTSQNIGAMEDTAKAVNDCTGLAKEAGNALISITNMIEGTTGMVRTIATASEEQSATSEEINSSVEEVSRLADDMAGAAASSAETMLTLSRLSDELRSVITTLKEQ